MALMKGMRAFKQKLARVFYLWKAKKFDAALREVESLLQAWPGNAQLHLLWASLVQLQERPAHDLDQVRQALQQAIDLDKSSPAAAIELGHFLDAVEDNPRAASRAYAEGIATAHQFLMEALIGQAKAFLQLGKRADARTCLEEVLHLMNPNAESKRGKKNAVPNNVVRSLNGRLPAAQLQGRFAAQISELMNDLLTDHPA